MSGATEAPLEVADSVIEAVADALGSAYDCHRTWSAWSYGTMSAADFSLVAEDSELVAEIARAAITAYLATQPAAALAPQATGAEAPSQPAFLRSVRALCIAARTTGGTAGRDEGLCAALDRVEAALEGLATPGAGEAQAALDWLGEVGRLTRSASDVAQRIATLHAALYAAPAAPAGDAVAYEAHLPQTEIRARVLGAIADYSSMLPEDGEDWESWYVAAFSMLSQKAEDIFDRAAQAAGKGQP